MTAIAMHVAFAVLFARGCESTPFACDATWGSIPATVTVPAAVREEVERLAERSATLRRQFGLISRARARVEILVSPSPVSGSRRAYATLDRYSDGFIHARISVRPGIDLIELLAHELEHVIEQIEGVDLSSVERTGAATRSSDGFLETARAQLAGRTAAAEVQKREVAVTDAP